MLTLRTVPTPSSTDAIGLLLECHERIRRFSRLAVRLASEPAPEKDVAEAARGVHRYFSKALPLHVEDEDRSLMPRLEPLAPEEVRKALARMNGEHRVIDALVEELLPHWAAIAEAPGTLEPIRADLKRKSEALETLMLGHLENEETLIFPNARRALAREQLEALAGEMRDRRKP